MSDTSLQDKLKHPDFLVVYGSNLYGTNTSKSDKDYRGFIMPPLKYMVVTPDFWNFRQSTAAIYGSPDTVIWSYPVFFGLLMKGDPQSLEMLFAPDNLIIHKSAMSDMLVANRHIFISRRVHARILGYAHAEWRKVRAVHQTIEKIKPDEDRVMESIRQVFGPPPEEYNEVKRILFLQHERLERPSTRKLGQKRKEQLAEFGYCVKSASHSLRLLGELKELHETGSLTFPRPDAKMLLDVKEGRIPYSECEALYTELFQSMRAKDFNSDLPRDCDRKTVRELYCNTISDYYKLPKLEV